MELSAFQYDIVWSPGYDNTVVDAQSRCVCASTLDRLHLCKLQVYSCQPGIIGMLHFVRTRDLPFSAPLLDLRSACSLHTESHVNPVEGRYRT